jgi:6-phosphogluconolactonase
MLRRLLKLLWLCSAFVVLPSYAGDDDDGLAYASGSCGSSWVYFGTRATGTGTGIFAARLDSSGHLTPVGIVSDINRATWLIAHPTLPVLYAASDPGGTAPSTIYSLAVDRETGALTTKNSALSGGIGATHMAVDEDLKSLFVAHFGSGQVSWMSTLRDGSVGALLSVQQQYGTGPNPRQTAPHAHGVVVDPTKRFLVANDFGADRIFAYRIDTKADQLVPAATPFTSVTAGSGPRHSVFHPYGNYMFVVSELASSVSSYRWDAWSGTLKLVQTAAMGDPTYTGTKSASQIQISRDGRFLYAANRGSNSMEVYSINIFTGTLQLIQVIPCPGVTPWDFALDPSGRWLLVAMNASNSIAEFAVDFLTGKLTATTETLSLPLPSNVTFMRADSH